MNNERYKCLWKLFSASIRLPRHMHTVIYVQHNHYNQRLGKIFAKANLCSTTIKWIRMSPMNMDDSWAIFVRSSCCANNSHRIKCCSKTAIVRISKTITI